MKVIGLTGGIGSGKSTVSSYLRDKGFHIIDADEEARKLTTKGSMCLENLQKEFGSEILFEDGSLNRKKLGEIVFKDKAKKEKLESLTTDVVVKNMEEETERLRSRGEYDIIFLDVPLLFETGLEKICDAVVVVTARDSVRIERVVARDGISSEQVKARINNQMSTEEKVRRATDVIDNSEGKEELHAQIEQLLVKYV